MNDTVIRNDVIETLNILRLKELVKEIGYPTNSILVVYNNVLTFIICDTNIIQFYYIESILPNIIISMRNKGMPKKINDICKPWIFTHNKNGIIKYKGSLHIRMKYV